VYNPWVVNIAKKYHACFPNVDFDELVAEGARGMLEALGHFDPSRGVKFSTYAWFWMIKNVQEYISSNRELIGVPRTVVTDLRNIVASMNDEIKKGNEPSFDAIARKLNMDVSTIREILSDKHNISRPVSLDKFLDDDDQAQTIGDMVEDKNDGPVQEILDRVGDRTYIAQVLHRLLPKEEEIVKLRFGFYDNRFYTLKDAGKKLKISPAKVKDLESVAIFKLKRLLSNREEEQ
jgi:RNA polymerase primary sigma factor